MRAMMRNLSRSDEESTYVDSCDYSPNAAELSISAKNHWTIVVDDVFQPHCLTKQYTCCLPCVRTGSHHRHSWLRQPVGCHGVHTAGCGQPEWPGQAGGGQGPGLLEGLLWRGGLLIPSSRFYRHHMQWYSSATGGGPRCYRHHRWWYSVLQVVVLSATGVTSGGPQCYTWWSSVLHVVVLSATGVTCGGPQCYRRHRWWSSVLQASQVVVLRESNDEIFVSFVWQSSATLDLEDSTF